MSILVSIAWQGPNKSQDHFEHVPFVQLHVEDKSYIVPIHPAHPLMFRNSQTNLLHLPLSFCQLRRAVLTAKVITADNRGVGPTRLDSNGNRVQQRLLHESNQQITLQLPEQVETDHFYRIQIISNKLKLTAQLIKEHSD